MKSLLLTAAAAVLGAAEALPRSGAGKVEVKFFAEAL
jgi:hypothetical protein